MADGESGDMMETAHLSLTAWLGKNRSRKFKKKNKTKKTEQEGIGNYRSRRCKNPSVQLSPTIFSPAALEGAGKTINRKMRS